MNLIGKMLADLEDRQADLAGQRDPILDGLTPVSDQNFPDNRSKWGIYVVGAGATLLASVMGYVLLSSADTPKPTLSSTAIETSAPGKSPKPNAGIDPAANPSEQPDLDEYPTFSLVPEVSAAQAAPPPAAVERDFITINVAAPESEADVTPQTVAQSRLELPAGIAEEADVTPQTIAPSLLELPAGIAEEREYWVVGSFKDQNNANRERDRIAQATRQAVQIVPFDQDGERFHRLLVPVDESLGPPGVNKPWRIRLNITDMSAASAPEGTSSDNDLAVAAPNFSRVIVSAEDIYRKGLQLYRSGNINDGLEQFTRALEEDPDHIQARTTLATFLTDQGRTEMAMDVLQQGLVLHPKESGWAQIKARLLLDADDVDGAVQTLRNALPDVQEDPEYHGFLAALLQRQDRHDEAVKYYKNILEVKPQKGIWWMGFGISLERIGEPRTANFAFEKALDDNTLSSELRSYINKRIMIVSRR